jgi:hypothetical protein
VLVHLAAEGAHEVTARSSSLTHFGRGHRL